MAAVAFDLSRLNEHDHKFIPEPMSGCWLWMYALDKNGYAVITQHVRGEGHKKKTEFVHRAQFVKKHGPVPDGKVLDHLCRVRCCVNPDHLEPVTQAVNVARGDAGINMSQKTHCPQGHEYNAVNTRVSLNGGRVCRACDRERQRIRDGGAKQSAETERAWK